MVAVEQVEYLGVGEGVRHLIELFEETVVYLHVQHSSVAVALV